MLRRLKVLGAPKVAPRSRIWGRKASAKRHVNASADRPLAEQIAEAVKCQAEVVVVPSEGLGCDSEVLTEKMVIEGASECHGGQVWLKYCSQGRRSHPPCAAAFACKRP